MNGVPGNAWRPSQCPRVFRRRCGPGGVIASPGAVTINTTGPNNAYGAWSDGRGSRINFSGLTAISTIGANAFGLFASNGGGDFDDRASDHCNQRRGANGVVANADATIVLSSGSTQTTGLEAFAIGAEGGGNVTISGVSVSTSGNASKGLAIVGTGSSLSASDLTVTTRGTINHANGNHAYGVYNGSLGGFFGGGTATLTNVTVQTSAKSG